MTKPVVKPPHGTPYRVRDGGYVQGIFYLQGKRITRTLCKMEEISRLPGGKQRSQNQMNRHIITLWVAKLEELQNEHFTPPGALRYLGDLFREWIDGSVSDKAPGTLDYYVRTSTAYLTAVGNHPIGELGPAQIDRFKAYLVGQGLSVASINIRLQNLKTFLRWAHEREFLERIPRIQQLRREKRLQKVLSEEEVLAWLHMLQKIRRHRKGQPPVQLPNNKHLHPNRKQRRAASLRETFILTLFETGCRFSEAFNLEMNQFDTVSGLLTIEFKPRFSIKEKREKVIPLTRRLKRRIAAIRKLSPLQRYLLDDGKGNLAYASTDSLATNLKRDMATLGYAGRGVKVVHGFRALFAHRLRERGAPLDAIKNLLGHSDIKVTEAYFPASQTREKAAVALLDSA